MRQVIAALCLLLASAISAAPAPFPKKDPRPEKEWKIPGKYWITWEYSKLKPCELYADGTGKYQYYESVYYCLWEWDITTKTLTFWELGAGQNGYEFVKARDKNKLIEYRFPFGDRMETVKGNIRKVIFIRRD